MTLPCHSEGSLTGLSRKLRQKDTIGVQHGNLGLAVPLPCQTLQFGTLCLKCFDLCASHLRAPKAKVSMVRWKMKRSEYDLDHIELAELNDLAKRQEERESLQTGYLISPQMRAGSHKGILSSFLNNRNRQKLTSPPGYH
jgi:hypothetical protein